MTVIWVLVCVVVDLNFSHIPIRNIYQLLDYIIFVRPKEMANLQTFIVKILLLVEE